MTRDFVGYGAEPPHARWPGEARIAVNFVINFEEGSELSYEAGDGVSETGLIEGASTDAGNRRDLAAETAEVIFTVQQDLNQAREFYNDVKKRAVAYGRSPDAIKVMKIWAVARHMIAEGLRMKIAIVFIAILLLVLPIMPFTLAGDGVTLTSRVQSFLTYSLTLAGVLLSLLTLFLSCATIAILSPAFTFTSVTWPAIDEGTSMVAFSVWISAIGSSSAIRSPSLLSQRRTVPSSIASPIFGIVSSAIQSPLAIGKARRRPAVAP
jgi:hypothetical protein